VIPLLMLLGAVLQQSEQGEVYRFGVQVRTVYVDVFVSRDGKALEGLTAEDFEVLDNGVPAEIDSVDPETMPLSAMLVLDTSGSVSGEKLDHLRSAAHAFVEGLKDKDEAGLMTFTHLWRLQHPLDDDFESLHETLERPMHEGHTGLNDALFAALELVEEGSGRPMVLLFTDGVDNASWLAHGDLLQVVRESEAIVYVVSLQSVADVNLREYGDRVELDSHVENPNRGSLKASTFLRTLARTTGGRTWYADTSADLRSVFLQVLEDMEKRYLLSYRVQGPLQEGWHTLEVRLKRRKADEIRARPGYVVNRNDN
jgi:VWFA-related protein